MTVLILLVCMGPLCHEEQVPGVEYVTPIGCAVHGEIDAQEWLGEHPKWTLKGWRCGPQRRGA